MPGGKLAPLMMAARTSFYVPIMLGSLARAGHSGAGDRRPPGASRAISLSLGGGIGRKIIADERKRQRTYRQQQAKAAVRRFVEEVAFIMNKQTRDGLRSTQRQLRDDFQARAMLMDRSAGAGAGGGPADQRPGRRAAASPAAGAGGRGPPPGRGADRGPGAGGRRWLTTWSSPSPSCWTEPRRNAVDEQVRSAPGRGPGPAARAAAAGHRRQGQGRQVHPAQRPARRGDRPHRRRRVHQDRHLVRRGPGPAGGGPPAAAASRSPGPGRGRAARSRSTSASCPPPTSTTSR